MQDTSMTLDEVDEQCEKWLEDHYDLSLDFSVEPTLAKCQDFGIVVKDAQVRMQPRLWAIRYFRAC